jgi:anti-sigma regulatory factor (Ser/Thr protein kinase)
MEPPSESRSWSRTLPAGPRTGAEARWFLAEALEDEDVDIDFDAAKLLTTEVATNAARHGKEPIELSIELEEQDLRVSVLDQGAGFDPKDEALRGTGITLIDALSSEWGAQQTEEGAEVWFKV